MSTNSSSPTRRSVVATAAAAGALALNTSEPTGIFGRAQAEEAARDSAIRPFTYHAPQAELDELRRRIVATRLPEKETVADQSQGVQLATIQKLARYWATEYDWRKVEARVNALPNFVTEIDGP